MFTKNQCSIPANLQPHSHWPLINVGRLVGVCGSINEHQSFLGLRGQSTQDILQNECLPWKIGDVDTTNLDQSEPPWGFLQASGGKPRRQALETELYGSLLQVVFGVWSNEHRGEFMWIDAVVLPSWRYKPPTMDSLVKLQPLTTRRSESTRLQW